MTEMPPGPAPPYDPAAQRERELALLEEVAQFLASARSREDIYPVLVRSAASIGAGGEHRWRAAYLGLDGDVLRPLAVHDAAGIDLGSRAYHLRDYPALRQVVERREPLFGDAATLSQGIPTDTAAVVQRAGVVVAAMVPVVHGDEVFGILSLTARGALQAAEVPFARLQAVAHLAALALTNARLFAEQEAVAARAAGLEVAKSRFLNLAAHEMRGPVTVLRGYASMLADASLGPLTPPMGQAVAMLRHKADELNWLVNKMLDIARLEEGQLALTMADLDLREVAERTVAGVSPIIGEAHVVSVVAGPDPLPIRGDPERLATVVTNLLDNASKYSPPGTPIEVRCAVAGERAVLAVTDRGIGLGADEQAVLFTRFGRVVNRETSHLPGSGLGLWLSREIARMHGGDVEVVSEQGAGSTFSLVLPLRAPETAAR